MIRGTCDQAFRPVGDAFAANFQQGEVGAACSITLDGHVVVDLWGGWADRGHRRAWTHDTMVNAFSVGKPVIALRLLQLVERGSVDLGASTDRYWPELLAGQQGATVRDMLCHRAGLPAIRVPLANDALWSWHAMCAAIAATDPWWQPGTRHAYHSNTYGHLIGELARKVDGRLPGTWLRDEIAGPLGADLAWGLTPAERARCANVVWEIDINRGIEWFVAQAETVEQRMVALGYANPPGYSGIGVVNSAAWRAAQVPSTNLHGTARGVARLYAALAAGGALDGVTVLDRDLLGEATSVQSEGWCPILEREVTFGLGFQPTRPDRAFGPNPGSFGHFGTGGVRSASSDAALALDVGAPVEIGAVGLARPLGHGARTLGRSGLLRCRAAACAGEDLLVLQLEGAGLVGDLVVARVVFGTHRSSLSWRRPLGTSIPPADTGGKARPPGDARRSVVLPLARRWDQIWPSPCTLAPLSTMSRYASRVSSLTGSARSAAASSSGVGPRPASAPPTRSSSPSNARVSGVTFSSPGVCSLPIWDPFVGRPAGEAFPAALPSIPPPGDVVRAPPTTTSDGEVSPAVVAVHGGRGGRGGQGVVSEGVAGQGGGEVGHALARSRLGNASGVTIRRQPGMPQISPACTVGRADGVTGRDRWMGTPMTLSIRRVTKRPPSRVNGVTPGRVTDVPRERRDVGGSPGASEAGSPAPEPACPVRPVGVADDWCPEAPHVPYYEFIVKSDSEVDPRALEAATGLRCTPLDRLARLDGELIDGAALHGVIARVYRLGLELQVLEQRSQHHAT